METKNVFEELEELKQRIIKDTGNKEAKNRVRKISNFLDQRFNSTCHTRAIETPKTPKIG